MKLKRKYSLWKQNFAPNWSPKVSPPHHTAAQATTTTMATMAVDIAVVMVATEEVVTGRNTFSITLIDYSGANSSQNDSKEANQETGLFRATFF